MEENKKRELGIAVLKENKLIEEKNNLSYQKEEILKQGSKQNSATIDIMHLKLSYQYATRMDKEIEKKEQKLVEIKKVIDKRRGELLQAVQERKIIDNLKSIHQEVYDEEEKKEENKIMDDMITFKYGFKKEENAYES